MAKKGEWIKAQAFPIYYIDSWSSDESKFILRIEQLVLEEGKPWVIDVMGVERFLVVGEENPDLVKRAAKRYLREVINKIAWTVNMKNLDIE